MQPCRENISQREANGFGAVAFAETGRILDADRQRRPSIVRVKPEKTDVTDKAVDVDDPGVVVLRDEADLGLRIAAGENGGGIEGAAIGLDDSLWLPSRSEPLHPPHAACEEPGARQSGQERRLPSRHGRKLNRSFQAADVLRDHNA
jgi:hypothetical protein